jgi:general secretion pathway protein D
LKTTTKTLVGGIAIVLVLAVRTLTAAPLDGMTETLLTAAGFGQLGSTNNPSEDSRQKTADLLQRARKAMAENDLVAADALISQAETLGVKQNIFYRGDTPEKARHDLDRIRNGNSGRPGLLAPLGANRSRQAPATDPFAGRPGSAPADAGNGQQVTPLPSVDGAMPISTPTDNRPTMLPPPGQGYPTTGADQNELRANGVMSPEVSNNNPLRKARLALAVGDVRQATAFVQEARNTQVNYQPLDDTPDKVDVAIRRHQEVQTLDKQTEAYARICSRSLMEQSDSLIRWGEYDEAERLGRRAAAMRVVYGPFEQKPQDVLQRIAEARRQAGVATPTWQNTPGFANAGASAPANNMATRQEAVQLVRQAREAIAAGQLDQAEAIARRAEQMRLPSSAFAPGEDRPELVLLDLQQLKQRNPSGVVQAGGQYGVAGASDEPDRSATRAVYDPANDPTRNARVSNEQPIYGSGSRYAQNGNRYGNTVNPNQPPAPPQPDAPTMAPAPSLNGASSAGPAQSQGMTLFQQGEAALRANDPARAYDLFRQAAAHTNELDPVTAQRLQDHLQLLSGPGRGRMQQGGTGLADQANAQQQLLVRQMAAELAQRESNARAMRATNPKGALAALEDARKRVEAAGLDTASRDQMLRSVDRAIAETKQVIEQNRPQIELADKNNRVRQDVERQQRLKVEVQEKVALKIDEYKRLVDEQRFAEAELRAKEAGELAPNDPVVVQVLWQAKFLRRFKEAKDIESRKEQGFVDALGRVDESSIPFDDGNPYVFRDLKEWKALSSRRQKFSGDRQRNRSEADMDIEKKLRTPVSLQFTNAPLSEVMVHLAKLAEVNLYLDPKGLSEEGVATDTPVTINLPKEIMLKSALNLILDPLRLSYVIKNEVLNVTSEQMRDVQVVTQTYNVADLVIPIPNFVPTPSMGLGGAYSEAMNRVGFGGAMPFASSTATPLSVVSNSRHAPMVNSPEALANQMGTGGHPSALSPSSPGQKNGPTGAGPGGLGGGAQPDFDSLIELITSTIKPTTWDTVGAPGSIMPFETNLSIVVSQTQEVHEEIVQLLEQLRRLQDLQVTIEVRFITLNDNFFERIGVDFDFDVKSNIGGSNVNFVSRTPPASGAAASSTNFANASGIPAVTTNTTRAITAGMSQPGVFSADLDVPVTQGSYSLAVPQFGGFDATAGAQMGFAILSDVEAYFFISAAQGDKRSNVLQAPKVTLFNGQQAFVSDTSQSPFVISVIPVVGDFAAAQQPVIVVLSEGTFMTVQAIVSPDRRFVRLTVVPFFSTIGEVNTFQFTGSTTTTTDSTRSGLRAGAKNPAKLWNNKGDSSTTTNSGTTVQLPTFSYVTVTTTVSVPDGGTVLLGGIKRLSEGRNEFGTPLLNKLPYINRLFKNVGIGRETQSLMMMVTPRIIIQEEEEEKMGVETAGQ